MEQTARFLVIFIIAWALQACQNQNIKPNIDTSGPGPDGISVQYIQGLLRQAKTAPPPQRVNLLLTAIESLALGTSHDWARSLAAEFPTDELAALSQTDPAHGRWALINSRLDARAGDAPGALARISAPAVVDNLHFYPKDLVNNIRELRAELLYDLGDYVASINERIILSPALAQDADATTINQELLWQTLMEVPLDELQQLAEAASTRAHKAWYQLADISRNNQTNMRAQLDQVIAWQRQWPEHPASISLPADLQLLSELVANQPKHIAVLLPSTGKFKNAGDAIKSGILAAYYRHKSQDPTPLEIHFYNSQEGDINATYDAAIELGAEIIIGPLEKDKIIALSGRLNLPVPTLALNAIDNPFGYVSNLYQFGLGVEDEAQLAAERAWRDGHRRILVLAPNTLWGDRCASAFAQQWRELGGEFAQDYRFTGTVDYSNVIQTALQVDQSKERAKRLRRLVGKLEFEPRRRGDIDAIFLAAQAPQARQIKPTLAFHYASKLPVYATRHVYDGTQNSKLNKDMNGILFSTMPWFFNPDAGEKGALLNTAKASTTQQPLYALGVDSFYLYPRLQQLQAVEGARFYGQTGALQLGATGKVTRKQVWAEFANGKAEELKATNEELLEVQEIP